MNLTDKAYNLLNWNDVFSREFFAQNSVTINPCKSGSLLLLALQVYAEMSHHLTKQ